MMHKIERRIQNSEPLKISFWSLVAIFVFCLFSYGYCVRGAIVNIVERQNMDKEITALGSKVSDLESEYIKAKNEVTMEKAESLGFVAVTSQKFVTRDAKNSPGLSMLTPGM